MCPRVPRQALVTVFALMLGLAAAVSYAFAQDQGPPQERGHQEISPGQSAQEKERDRAKADALKQKQLEQERAKAEALRQRQLEQERARAEALKQKQLEQERAKAEALRQRQLEQERAKAEAEKQRQLEQDKARAEALKQKQLEQERAKAEALRQRQLEQDKAKAEALKQKELEEERAKAEADKQKQLEQERAKAEAQKQLERGKQLELDKAKAEALKQKELEEERAKAEAEKLKKLEQDKAEALKAKPSEQPPLAATGINPKAAEQLRVEHEKADREFEKAKEEARKEREEAKQDGRAENDEAREQRLEGLQKKFEVLRQQRRERVEDDGRRLVIEEPDSRKIVREEGQTFIRHDETERIRRIYGEVHQERRGDVNVNVVVRPGGVQIFTDFDDEGRPLRRYCREPDGREFVLFDNRDYYRRARPDTYLDAIIVLPPPIIHIPRERYIVDYEFASDDDIFYALSAPPVERLERTYSLEEVRYSRYLRDRMPRIDLDTIHFDFGSWEVDPDQYPKLERVAHIMNRIVDERPDEMFLIEGHTDAVGSDIDNLTLSDRRAEAVAEILTREFNVPAENLTTQGYGKQFLKIDTPGPERANRRVAIRRITPLLSRSEYSLRD